MTAPASPRPDSAAHGAAADAPDDARYLALLARDARFDGSFYTGVTSTGIYCRPVCRVRLPKRENCRFFDYAAQAEQAGFRPCLRCRPELAPRSLPWTIQDASSTLAQQAMRLLDEPLAGPAGTPAMAQLAQRLGISARHLRRIFEAQFGVSPLRYLQTRRLLTAKQLLCDTSLPIAQLALISGFASVRRFNTAFVEHYRLSPGQLRRAGAADPKGDAAAQVIRLAYRPPYDVAAMLAFWRTRHIHAIESVASADAVPVLRKTLRLRVGQQEHCGWLEAQFDPARHHVLLRVSDSLCPVLPQVIRQVRAALDLDAEPQAINAVLLADFPGSAGLRVPGALDGFELAVRAYWGNRPRWRRDAH